MSFGFCICFNGCIMLSFIVACLITARAFENIYSWGLVRVGSGVHEPPQPEGRLETADARLAEFCPTHFFKRVLLEPHCKRLHSFPLSPSLDSKNSGQRLTPEERATVARHSGPRTLNSTWHPSIYSPACFVAVSHSGLHLLTAPSLCSVLPEV